MLLLEIQLQRQLANAGCERLLSFTKGCTGIDIALHIRELGVVKEVEEFCSELEIQSLGDMGVLQQSHIPIVNTRPVEKAPA